MDPDIYAPELTWPEPQTPPRSLSPEEMDALLQAALEELPDPLRRALENVEILIEPAPSARVLRALGLKRGEHLLGVYEGCPRTRQDCFVQFPCFITLFQRNLERYAGRRDRLIEQVYLTLWHEIGHHLGLNEAQLRARGL